MVSTDEILAKLKTKIEELDNNNDYNNKFKKHKKMLEKQGIDIPLAKIHESIIINEYPEKVEIVLEEFEKSVKIRRN